MTYYLKRTVFYFFIAFSLLISNKLIANTENFLGKNDAKVTIIEYASMTCGHCATFHEEIFPKIKEKYIKTGKVKFIYRDFPLDKQALFAAILAKCAPKEKYFDYVKLIYQTRDKWISHGVEDEFMNKLKKIGKMAGLGQKDMETCFKNEQLVDEIINIRSNAEKKYGIDSTPSFIINEKKYGSLNFQGFEKVLDKIIN